MPVPIITLLLEVQRRGIQAERLTVHQDGTVASSAAYLEYLRVHGIVIPEPPVLFPR